MNSQKQTPETLPNVEVHNLIHGVYTPDEASDILMHLVNTKIVFHQNRSFSEQLKTGKTAADSQKRIQELHQLKEQLKDRINLAREMGHTLRIQSVVEMEHLVNLTESN